MIISGADSAHHHTGCTIPEEVDTMQRRTVMLMLCGA